MQILIEKITSRKFFACIAGVVLGICMIFGLDEGTVNTIAGAVTSIASLVIYIYTEGKIDAAAVEKIQDTVEVVLDAAEVVGEIEE